MLVIPRNVTMLQSAPSQHKVSAVTSNCQTWHAAPVNIRPYGSALIGGGVGGTPQGLPFIFFPKPVVSEKKKEHPRWIRLLHTTQGSGNIITSLKTLQLLEYLPTSVIHFLNNTNMYRWHCRKALWSPSSWLSGRPSSNEQSGTRSL